jgi:predicted PurR-regulated permease PerM
MSRAALALRLAAPQPGNVTSRDFLRRLLAVVAIVVLAVVAWRLGDVLLLAFGAALVAGLLHALANPLVEKAGLGRPLALSVAALVLVSALGACLWLFGQQGALQLAALGELLPRAWSLIQSRLADSALGAVLLQDLRRIGGFDGWLLQISPSLLRGAAGAGAATVIVLFAGLYLAFHPRTYVGGLLRLFPISRRARAAEIFQACAKALHGWLIGQLISMVLVGVTTGAGLWIAGVPSAFGLGLLAGVAQFVPVVGPMAATVPGLIIAAAESPETLLWAAVVYVGAMQLEANLITPLLLRQMVELPMAVTLFAVLAMGVLLGPLGVLFATPLAVVAYVLVRMAYVEDLLGDRNHSEGIAT